MDINILFNMIIIHDQSFCDSAKIIENSKLLILFYIYMKIVINFYFSKTSRKYIELYNNNKK